MSSAATGRASGRPTGERSSSAGGWVSPRPSRSEPSRNSSPPTSRTPATSSRNASTSVVHGTGDQRRGGSAHAPPRVAPPARRVGVLDDPDDLVDVVGDGDQFQVVRADRAVRRHGAPHPVEQAGPVL